MSDQNKIVDFEDLKNKHDLDEGKITVEDLTSEELDAVADMYIGEIAELSREIRIRKERIRLLKAENERLKKLLGRE